MWPGSAELRAWVDRFARVQWPGYMDRIAPCWANHPEAVWELSNLITEWTRIYGDPENRPLQDAALVRPALASGRPEPSLSGGEVRRGRVPPDEGLAVGAVAPTPSSTASPQGPGVLLRRGPSAYSG